MQTYTKDEFLAFATLQQHEQLIIEIFEQKDRLTIEMFVKFYSAICHEKSLYNQIVWFNFPEGSK